MKVFRNSLVFILGMALSFSVQASDVNELVQSCEGGTIARYRNVRLEERGMRFDQLFTGSGDVDIRTVAVTILGPDGRDHTFTRCEFMKVDEHEEGESFISVRDCNSADGYRSPAFVCRIIWEDASPPARVNDSYERESLEGSVLNGPRGTGVVGE